MTERTLDWKPKWDERSGLFRMAALDCYVNGKYRTSILRKKTEFLDQGSEGACTGFGCAHVLNATPNQMMMNNSVATGIYLEARRQDEWEGENYEGSSVNGAMRAARVMGYVSEWHWALNTQEMRHGLSYHGAGEAGTWWHAGMWDTDTDGHVHPTGGKVGGHAYAIVGYQTVNARVRYRIENSWGPKWGNNGGAWIWEDEFQTLLEDEGEMAFPKKVR